MKTKAVLILIILWLITIPAFGVELIYTTTNGTGIYKCNSCCEKVKVIRDKKGYYRVYATYFAKKVKAASAYNAAEVACRSYGPQEEE